MVKRLTIAAAATLALLVAGCAANNSSPQPPTQRNTLGQTIDPQTGLPAPGSPGYGGY
jgi:outer membrane murein-binding lipoprotein Lpp